jgi:hypothetical protein
MWRGFNKIVMSYKRQCILLGLVEPFSSSISLRFTLLLYGYEWQARLEPKSAPVFIYLLASFKCRAVNALSFDWLVTRVPFQSSLW